MVLRGCTVKRTHHWTTLLGQRWPQTCRRITSWFSFSSIQWRLKVSIRNIHRQILSHFLIRHLKSLVSYLVWCPDYFFERAQRNAVWERDFSPDFAGCIDIGSRFPRSARYMESLRCGHPSVRKVLLHEMLICQGMSSYMERTFIMVTKGDEYIEI